MPLEIQPPRSPERCPQLMEDPVHRFGPYHLGENLTIMLSRFTIGEVVEPQVRRRLCIMGPSNWVKQPFAAVSEQKESLDPADGRSS